MSLPLIQNNGFVHAADIHSFRAADNAHSFRLVYLNGWKVFSSFFGGRIGSLVNSPGPNNEEWCCGEIVAPLKSKEWTFKFSPVLQPPLFGHIEWQDPSRIMPSLQMVHIQSSFHASPIAPSPK